MSRLQWPRIVDRAADIVTSYDEVGSCTLRQAYYRLVAAGLIPHTAPTYRRLSARLAQARREERFPELIDPLREVHAPPAWPDAGAFLRDAPDWFGLDRTAGQTTALYVACEKDTLRAQLTGWVDVLSPEVGAASAAGGGAAADGVGESLAAPGGESGVRG
ncbi:hypothetical protein [Streptomyces pinistramenti]|uniref:hypothetical protein n=1 Tax=Streptomyces pinistramenti TaxID=2884812 RepID=UPI001D0992AD|nr:hypothetical protein [Streptomyces pinistramenti]MCB5910367.1 hypothetical protein [Streptomyces pinistramenti]